MKVITVECSTCKYWERQSLNRAELDEGLPEDHHSSGRCRRFPPQVMFAPGRTSMLGEAITRAPRTNSEDWCGEWLLQEARQS